MMADFDDITGWEEELAAFEVTEEGKEHFRISALDEDGSETVFNRKFPKLPLSLIVELTKLKMRHPEIRALLDKQCAWQDLVEAADARGETMGEDHPDHYKLPFDEMKKLRCFRAWFCMKKMCPFNQMALGQSFWLAYALWDGSIPSFDSPELHKWAAKKHYCLVID